MMVTRNCSREHRSPKWKIFSRLVIKPPKADSELQSAALRISLVVIPKFAATEDDAPHSDWAVKLQ